MKVRVYPADKRGRCIKGFCPTLCEESRAQDIAWDIEDNLELYGIEYDHMVISK